MSARWPRRVLMTADTIGGVWTYVVDLVREFDRAGIEVVLATMGERPSAAQRREVGDIPRCALHESRFRLEWMPDPWRDVAAAGEWLLALERDAQPDLVHLNGYVHAQLPWQAPRVVAAHSCVCSWWEAVHGETAPAAWDRYRAAVRAGLHAADLVLAPTAAMAANVVRHYGRLRRLRVAHNGRAPDGFVPADKQPLILGAGRAWDAGKNLAALDRAAARLPWPVCIAGDRVAPDGTVCALQHARAPGAVSAAALGRLMGRADIYALPARYEPFGLSVLEAALCRCALVLGDIDSLRELWTGAAVFVDPADDDALAWTLRRLIDRPDLRARMAARACARAGRRTPAAMAAAVLDAYRSARTAAAA